MTTSKATQLTITIPDGATPGTILSIPIKSGSETVKARVPEGLGPGGTLVLVKPEGSDQWVEELPDALGNTPLEDTTQLMPPSPPAPVKNLVAYTVRLDTTVGIIDIIVRPDWAPHGAKRFLELAAVGDLDDLAFYRAVKGCLAQFGLPARRQWPPLPDDPPTGVPFLLGAVCFAAVQQDSRKSTLFICIGDMSHCFGQNAWETPIGAVAESSLDVLERIETIYGDIRELNGAGPDTSRLSAEGNSYLRSDFPLLTYIRSAWPLDWQLSSEEQPMQPLADGLQARPLARDGLASASNGVVQAIGSRFPMVSQLEGKYFLQSSDQSQCLKGSYAFNPRTGELSDQGSGEVVGRFSCDPISLEPIPIRCITAEASMRLPCIRIEDSDVMAEMQKACHAGAVFVLPSQLNGAEYPSHNTIVDNLDSYRYDNTVGPRAQLAVHPAPGQFVLDNAACDRRPHGVSSIAENLQRAREAGFNFQFMNGYLSIPLIKDVEEMNKSIHIVRQHLHSLRLLAMQDVPACGLTSDKRALSRTNHKVSLIYASGVPVQACMNAGVNADQEAFQIQVAEAILFAQYYGALKLAARKRAGVTVFLLPLGGGNLNNPWESIAAAMSRAVEMLSDEERALLDIRALTQSSNPVECNMLSKLLHMHGKLKVMNGGGQFMGAMRGMSPSLRPPAVQPNTAALSTGPQRSRTEVEATRRSAELAEAALGADSVTVRRAARTGGTGPQANSAHLGSQAHGSPPHLTTQSAYAMEQQQLLQRLQQLQQLQQQALHPMHAGPADQVPIETAGGHTTDVPVEVASGQPVGVPVEIMPPNSGQYVTPYTGANADEPAHMMHRLYSNGGGPPRSLSPMPRRHGNLGATMRMRSSPSPTQTTVSTMHYGEPTVTMTNVHHYPPGAPPLGMSAPRHLNHSPSSPMPTHTQPLSPMPPSLGLPGVLQDCQQPMEGFQSPATAPPPWAMGLGGPSLGFRDPSRGPAYGSQDQMPRYGEPGPSPYDQMPRYGEPGPSPYEQMPRYGEPGPSPYHSGPMQVPPQMGPATSYQPPPFQPPMGLDLGGGPPLGVPSGGFPGGQQDTVATGALGMLSWSPLQAPQLIPPMLNSPMLPGLGGPPLGPPMGPQDHPLGMAGSPPPYPWPMQY